MYYLKVVIFRLVTLVWIICCKIGMGVANNKIWMDSFEPARRYLDKKNEIQQPQGRIIGGRNTGVGQCPYQVAMFMRSSNSLWCGGTIYNRRTILTAAHCFHRGRQRLNESEFVFAVGKSKIGSREGTEMQRLASQVIVHPDYDLEDGIFDVAIVKLNVPLRYTYHVQPLPLGIAFEGGQAIISGWGYTRVRESGSGHDSSGYTSFLKWTQIKIYKKTECAELYGRLANSLRDLVLHKNYLCAGVSGGGVDACSGDSGGPLACLNSTGEKYLCGIIASGVGCGLPDRPGFYMNVTVFQPWIELHAGKPDKPKRT